MIRNRKGSVLLLTLFLVVLAAFALSRFIERAYSEILAEAVHAERDRLRMEAYSALESTVAVLFHVARMDGQLYSPDQGWADPVLLAGVYLSDGLDLRIEFVDEMGKVPLPTAGRDRLLRLFEVLEFDSIDAQELTEALLGWMSREQADQSFVNHARDYERSELPYQPPYRPLHSFYELAAIAGFREAFFDGQGVPNHRFHRLTSLASLYNFNTINVNSASPEVLRIWSDVGEHEAENITAHRERVTGYKPYFENLDEAAAQLGVPLGEGYGVTTHCLRVNITVTRGTSSFVLSTVVAPAGQAGSLRPPAPAPIVREGEQGEPPARRGSRPRQPVPTPTGEPRRNVPYPYAFLEIRENESIL